MHTECFSEDCVDTHSLDCIPSFPLSTTKYILSYGQQRGSVSDSYSYPESALVVGTKLVCLE